MLLLPASRPARQGNFSILHFVICMSNRHSATRSRGQLSVTTSHEARSAPLRLGDSAGPLGNFSILSLSVSLSNRLSAPHEASTDSTLRQLRGAGTSILDPKAGHSKSVIQMEGGSPLEGGKAFRPLRFPVGRTSNKLRAMRERGKSWPQPGRVGTVRWRNPAVSWHLSRCRATAHRA
jgi:hypothetical protein